MAAYAAEVSHKCLLVAVSVVSFHALFALSKLALGGWCRRSGAKLGDAANRVTSNIHAHLGAFAAVYELYRRAGCAGPDAILGTGACASTGVAEYAIAVSAGYMLWDVWCMVHVGFEPLAPLIAHHTLSGACLCLVAFVWPEGVWINCVLLLTELAVGVKDAVWALEHDQAIRPRPALLRGARFALVGAWLAFRIAPFPVLVRALLAHGDAISSVSPALFRIACAMTVLLLAFNLETLRVVALPGFPWRPNARKAE